MSFRVLTNAIKRTGTEAEKTTEILGRTRKAIEPEAETEKESGSPRVGFVSRWASKVIEETEQAKESVKDAERKAEEAADRIRKVVEDANTYIQTQDLGQALFDSYMNAIPKIEKLTKDLIEQMREGMQEGTIRGKRYTSRRGNRHSRFRSELKADESISSATSTGRT